jgi:hypothetical protein
MRASDKGYQMKNVRVIRIVTVPQIQSFGTLFDPPNRLPSLGGFAPKVLSAVIGSCFRDVSTNTGRVSGSDA